MKKGNISTICNNCLSRDVCIIKKDLQYLDSKYSGKIHISEMSCIYKNTAAVNPTRVVEPREDPMDKMIDAALENMVKNVGDTEFKGDDLTKEELEEIKFKDIYVNGEKKVLYKCPTCGCEDYHDAFFKCEECGKISCSNCGVYDNTTLSKLCEKCW